MISVSQWTNPIDFYSPLFKSRVKAWSVIAKATSRSFLICFNEQKSHTHTHTYDPTQTPKLELQNNVHILVVMSNTWSSLLHPIPVSKGSLINVAPGLMGPVGVP